MVVVSRVVVVVVVVVVVMLMLVAGLRDALPVFATDDRRAV